MNNRYLTLFSTILLLGLVIVLGAENAALAQKGDKDDKHGNRHGGERHGRDKDRGDDGDERRGRHRDRDDDDDDRGARRQRQIEVFQDRDERRSHSDRDQFDREQFRQAGRQEFRRNRERDNRRIELRQHDFQREIFMPRHDNRRSDRGNGRQWNIPPGFRTRRQNDEWRDDRDDRNVSKEFLKELRRQARENRREYQRRVQFVENAPEFWQNGRFDRGDRNRQFDRNRNGFVFDDRFDDRFDNRPSWKEQLLSTVLSQFLGGGLNNSFGRDNGFGYNQPQSYGYNDSRLYNTQYGGNYGQPQYNTGYDNGGYNNNGGFGGYDPGSFINALPYAGMIDQFSGGFATDMIRQALGMGYDEGFMAGQYARRNGTSDDNYYDPYAYPQGNYDGASISLAERRQILSEGYELGYQDALNGRNGDNYDPQTEGSTDLVSLLLNNVLRMI